MKKWLFALGLLLVFALEAKGETVGHDFLPHRDAVYGLANSPCGFSYQSRYGGVGDLHNDPSGLKYVPSSIPTNSTSELREWWRKVSEEIDHRFRSQSPIDSQDKLVVAVCAFEIRSDKKIVNIKMSKAGSNPEFSSMMVRVLESLNGDAILDFPQSYEAEQIQLRGRFVQNYGPKYMLKKAEAGS